MPACSSAALCASTVWCWSSKAVSATVSSYGSRAGMPFVASGACAFFCFVAACMLLRGVAWSQDFGRRERAADILHYDIRIHPDERTRSLRGDVRVDFTMFEDTARALRLDAVDMRFDSVFVDGRSAPFAYDGAIIAIALPETSERAQRRQLRMVYECTPQKGMYFIGPDASFPLDRRQIWTQGQGEDNRYWFPCYDFPNDKASSEVRVTVDSVLVTVGNGRLIERRNNGDGSSTWHWKQEQAHSSYLIMLAVGDYAVFEDAWDGIPVRSYHYPEDKREDVLRAAGETAAMVEFFSKDIGLRYPWAKYAQIPVAHYLYGGMENTSATILADTRFVVDARAALDYEAEPLVAHELAHQWWGDYITYIDWNNEWLNEGFATYYQQRWTLHRHGRDAFDLQRHQGVRNYLDWADKAGRLPVVHRVGTGAANTYSKGAAVLHMLEDMLGSETFRRVMLRYIERFALGSVESNDLKRVIEEETGKNLQWFFQQWLYKAGYPELRIETHWEEARGAVLLSVRQVQRIDSLCGRFRFPLTVALHDGNGAVRELRVDVLGPDSTFVLPAPRRPGMIEVDPAGVLVGRIAVEYTVAELASILEHSRHIGMRLRAIEDLRARIDEAGVREALLRAAGADGHREVRKAALACIADAAFPTARDRDNAKALFLRARHDAASGVRATAYGGLRRLGDAALRPLFEEGLLDSSYYVEAAAMNCLLAIDTVTTWDVLRSRLTARSHGDILCLAALDWVRSFPTSECLEILHTLAGPGHSLAVRAKAFEQLLYLEPRAEKIRSLLLGMSKEPRSSIRQYAASALPLLGRHEARAVALDMLAQEKHPYVRERVRAVLAATEAMR